MNPERVLGIDPGLDRTGWALVSKSASGGLSLDSSGLLHTRASVPFPERLDGIFRGINKIILDTRPSCIAVEEIYFMKAAAAVAATIQARGVIILAAQTSGCRVESYNPRTVKMTLTGNGSAQKAQMQRMTQLALCLREIPRPDDVADAMAIALCHIRKGALTAKIKAAMPI